MRLAVHVVQYQSKLMVECEVRVLDEVGTHEAECRRKVESGVRAAGAIRSQVDTRGLQLECARVLNESLLLPVLLYRTKTMIWKKERSRIRAVQMDNLRGLLGIRRLGGWIKSQMQE